MAAMNDKELLQLVLKIDEVKGKALCEKLLRRFGHGKKHSGWKLDGFNPHGREDQKVKFVTARVDEVKRLLKAAGEKKWATTLKTSSLRDMMSGVRKVAEEVRERCRGDEKFVENGSEVHRLIRNVFSNTNWSCHSQDGDNPFLVTPDNQNEAMNSLEKLVQIMLTRAPNAVPSARTDECGDRKGARGGSGATEEEEAAAAATATAKCDEEFGLIAREGKGGRLNDEQPQQLSALWAFPSSIGQLSTA